MAKKRITPDDRQALQHWESYYKNLQDALPIDHNETPTEKAQRIQSLEQNPEAWFKYYLWKYYKSEPAPFHIASTKRIIGNPEWYEVRAWSRELAKSARAMMEILYLALTGRKRFIIIASATNESAIRLLKPFKKEFEENPRIINDYGEQYNHGEWAEDQFVIKKGAAFLALGAGNVPRGARNKDARPDFILVDDFDTDADCRNPDIVDKKWEWFERALFATRSFSTNTTILFNGNIIAEYCCIRKAIEVADYADIINIRDKNGKSSWAAKNTEAFIDRVLSKVSAATAQGEYFNNPIKVGKVFQELHYDKILPLHRYKFLVSYTDPSYKKNGDYKATAIIGKHKDEYHILDMFCRKTTTAEMLDFLYQNAQKAEEKGVPMYFYIEYPWIDEPLKREIRKANQRYGITLPLRADERKKPEKFFRIESKLEPLNRSGKLIFNENIKASKDMKETEFQFLALSPNSRVNDDAPDCVEGGVCVVDQKTFQSIGKPTVYRLAPNQKRY